MIINFNLKKFLVSIIIPLAIGGLSAFITKDNMDLYSKIVTPAFSPPGWLFPIVWSVLYTLLGVSLYLVWNKKTNALSKTPAFVLFAIQLLLNFIWSPIFFNKQWFLLAFAVLIALLFATLAMIYTFYKISKPAAFLQIPYILWLAFAGYLNLAIYLLN